MIEFRRISVDELPAQARHYLSEAVRRTPASTDRIDITLELAKKYGDIYTVHNGSLTGAIYLLTYNTKAGKVLSPVLVGGKNLSHWQKDLHDFLIGEANRIGAIAIRFIARKGWQKMYPMCKNIGTIYELKLSGPSLQQ